MQELLTQFSGSLKPTTMQTILKNINSNKEWQSSSRVQVVKDFFVKYLNTLKESEHNWRLPKTSAPISYELNLKSHIYSGSSLVEGEVSIRLHVTMTTDHLTLHSRSININNLRLLQADGVTEVTIINFSLYTPTDMLTIYLVDDVASGTEFVLNIKYTFNMNLSPSQTGFYRTSYKNSDNLTRFVIGLLNYFTRINNNLKFYLSNFRYVASTHLVHTYARTVMPCYDEPSFTAVFKLRITHHESYRAVTNTEGVRRAK